MEQIPLAQAAGEWDVEAGYLNTSSYGPPPRRAWDALTGALDEWRYGRTSWEPWAAAVQTSRTALAGLLGVPADTVSTGATVSQVLAPVAAAVPDGATVLVPETEFTSAIFPFAVHADRGLQIRSAPLAEFAGSIRPGVDVVAFSAVQSAGGEVADVASITARAREIGAITVLDVTQAAGWLDIDYTGVDIGAGSAYKWLCSPRGTAFGWLRPDLEQHHPEFFRRLRPLAAGWFAGQDVHDSYYGLPLRLAADARRFDISPAWHCWVGTAPAVELLAAVGSAAINAHNVALANDFLVRLDQPESDSAIVSVPADDDAQRRLTEAGVRFGVRAGRVRVAFHLYSTPADVDRAVAALLCQPLPTPDPTRSVTA